MTTKKTALKIRKIPLWKDFEDITFTVSSTGFNFFAGGEFPDYLQVKEELLGHVEIISPHSGIDLIMSIKSLGQRFGATIWCQQWIRQVFVNICNLLQRAEEIGTETGSPIHWECIEQNKNDGIPFDDLDFQHCPKKFRDMKGSLLPKRIHHRRVAFVKAVMKILELSPSKLMMGLPGVPVHQDKESRTQKIMEYLHDYVMGSLPAAAWSGKDMQVF